MKSSLKYSILIILFILISIFLLLNYHPSFETQLKNIDLDSVDNLMIVAHPDDETLWGGVHLLKDRYLVVCVTCGRNKTRYHEIKQVLEISDDELIALWYPDKIKGKRDDWYTYYGSLHNELYKLITLKKWNLIVTHNPEGEYGHFQHRMVNSNVTDIYNNLNLDTDLYYFGKYYSKRAIVNHPEATYKISDEDLEIKTQQMIKKYKSQKFIEKKFKQMFKYEDWYLYEREDNNKD